MRLEFLWLMISGIVFDWAAERPPPWANDLLLSALRLLIVFSCSCLFSSSSALVRSSSNNFLNLFCSFFWTMSCLRSRSLSFSCDMYCIFRSAFFFMRVLFSSSILWAIWVMVSKWSFSSLSRALKSYWLSRFRSVSAFSCALMSSNFLSKVFQSSSLCDSRSLAVLSYIKPIVSRILS